MRDFSWLTFSVSAFHGVSFWCGAVFYPWVTKCSCGPQIPHPAFKVKILWLLIVALLVLLLCSKNANEAFYNISNSVKRFVTGVCKICKIGCVEDFHNRPACITLFSGLLIFSADDFHVQLTLHCLTHSATVSWFYDVTKEFYSPSDLLMHNTYRFRHLYCMLKFFLFAWKWI